MAADNVRIDSGIDIPAIHRGAREKIEKYPFSKLKVGDSFFIDGVSVNYMTNAYNQAAKELGYKFTARTRTEGGVKGVRVWRIKDSNSKNERGRASRSR